MTPEELVDPDVLAWRQWFHERLGKWAPSLKEDTLKGRLDNTEQARAYLAGARTAREQERERAKVLVEYVEIDAVRLDGVGGRALNVLAKYRGEA